jgi:NADPH:quinone reductase-like Zn-dependent oxidoreductase
MTAASLNFRDLLTVNGIYGPQYKLPLIPLSDGCGVVEAAGPDVTRFKAGDRVSTLFFSNWVGGKPTRAALMTALGGSLDGVWRETIILPETGVAHAPAHMSDLEVATLPCAALTAWRALMVEGGLQAGETVVVQGTGGVSIFALQFAKAAGAEVIVTSSSDEKLARVREMGADHTINYKVHAEWSKQVREITGGRGADHVVEVGGAGTFNESLKCIAIGGHVSVIGVLSGAAQNVLIPMLIGTNCKVQGISVGNAEQFDAMSRAMAANKIKPVVSHTFAFAQAQEALGAMAGQSHFGKIAIDFSA